jgi:excisionase family DNA binding protein
MKPEFYTVSQLARMLQVTEMTIYRMVRRGDLPCHSIGRAKRFRHSDIEAFLHNCRTGTEVRPDSATAR